MDNYNINLASVISKIATPEVKGLVLNAARSAIIDCMVQLSTENIEADKKATKLECYGSLISVLDREIAASPTSSTPLKRNSTFGQPPPKF